MNTDELVTLLAKSAGPVEPRVTTKRFASAIGYGLCVTIAVMLFMLGVRPDISQVVALPMFWVKLLFPASVAAIALYAATRLARPGMKPDYAPGLLGAIFAALWILAGITMLGATPLERRELVFGDTWLFCIVIIPLLAIPVFVAAMWAMKGLAPTRLRLAGSAAGLLSGAMSAAVYAMHCPELGAPFIAIWYVLGMLIPVLAGGLIGPRVLRW
jgi:hypothetical protein